jgi:hypothetical protein
MVDFRYHVVSIVAVFLALGIGIVFGTTAINRTLLDDLDHNVARLAGEKRDLEAQRKQLTSQVGAADEWGRALYPGIVSGVLTAERVVVVSAPGASKSVRDDLVKQLGTAGATVTGRIRLNDALLDPRRAAELDDLVLRELPAGFTVPGGGATAAQRAMAELAYVVSLGAGDITAVGAAPPAATTRVLAAFRERGFIGVDGAPVSPARNVVVLLPGAPPSPTPTPTASGPAPRPVGVDLVAALATLRARPVVVAAAPTGGSVAGSVLELVRADPLVKDVVSSVDDVDTVYGQTALVLAIDEAHHGRTGHYGNGVGADAPVPTPAPSP